MNFFRTLLLCLLICNLFHFSSCTSPQTINYEGEKYTLYDQITVKYHQDSFILEFFISKFTLNPDGDIRRILHVRNDQRNLTVKLSNAVINFTDIIMYQLHTPGKDILWLEDNFSSTAIDLTEFKVMDVTSDMKPLNEILPTGSPSGILNPLSLMNMLSRININSKVDFRLIDSIEVQM